MAISRSKMEKQVEKAPAKAKKYAKKGEMPVEKGKISYTYRKDAFKKVKLA